MLTYFQSSIRFHRAATMPEQEVRAPIPRHGCTIERIGYVLKDEGKYLEYTMLISTRNPAGADRLSETLTKTNAVTGFRISPPGEL